MSVALAGAAGTAIGAAAVLVALVAAVALRGLRRSLSVNRRAVDFDILRAMGQPPPGEPTTAQRETERGRPPEVGSLFTPQQPKDH